MINGWKLRMGKKVLNEDLNDRSGLLTDLSSGLMELSGLTELDPTIPYPATRESWNQSFQVKFSYFYNFTFKSQSKYILSDPNPSENSTCSYLIRRHSGECSWRIRSKTGVGLLVGRISWTRIGTTDTVIRRRKSQGGVWSTWMGWFIYKISFSTLIYI